MKRKQFVISRTKKVLLDKKRRGQKYVIWKISKQQLDEICRLGFKAEPYLYEIKTRKFKDIRLLTPLLKDLHFANKRGKKSVVRHLKDSDLKILIEYEVKFYILKYKIYLV